MPKVLIIEDDPDMRNLEQMALRCSGYHVITAVNGRDGYAKLTSERPCVVLLDLMMPVMDGLQFLEKVRAEHIDTGPIICVTAAGPPLIRRARELGAATCVEKPTDFDELCTLVQQYCPS